VSPVDDLYDIYMLIFMLHVDNLCNRLYCIIMHMLLYDDDEGNLCNVNTCDDVTCLHCMTICVFTQADDLRDYDHRRAGRAESHRSSYCGALHDNGQPDCLPGHQRVSQETLPYHGPSHRSRLVHHTSQMYYHTKHCFHSCLKLAVVHQ